jgi:hypothetical protein
MAGPGAADYTVYGLVCKMDLLKMKTPEPKF